MKNVLILCTGNSCRSQMAEALWRDLGKGTWAAQSAGTHPTGEVHPLAIEAMAEIGLDLKNARSKSIEGFLASELDLVITVCDGAQENCPTIAGARETFHWPFDDPASATGPTEEKMEFFRRVRDEIRQRIQDYLRTST